MLPWKKKDNTPKVFEPIQLHFQDVSFAVKKRKKLWGKGRHDKTRSVTILENISGCFQPGTVTAIMGSSGAGKTTLMDVLSGRAVGKKTGEIRFNGHPRDEDKSLQKHVAYVMQHDVMLRTQTPTEVLTFAANLRLPKQSREERKEKVKSLLEEMNLVYCKDTQVGAPGLARGISGGERKRLAIGVELITDPSLIFLDEPTSGLDSETAENVMDSLRRLTEKGRTVALTIHQPNSQIFLKFDNLMLLAKGRVVYNGPTSEAISYFASIGFPCPDDTNPPDYFMDLLHVDASHEDSAKTVNQLIEFWKQHPKELPPVTQTPVKPKAERNQKDRANIFKQVMYLYHRNVSDIVREPLKMRALAGQTLFLAVLIGLAYLRLGRSQQSVQSLLGALFFVLLNQTMSALFSVINTYDAERNVFIRERADQMYSTGAYFIAKILADLPFQLIAPAVFASIVFWMVGFDDNVWTFIIFLLDIVITSNVGAAIGLFIAVVSPNGSVAAVIAPALLLPFIVFSGFVVNNDNIPVYFIWIPYISFAKYSFQILVVQVFGGQTFTCNPDEVCVYRTGDELINSLGFGGTSVVGNFFILIGMYGFFRVATFFALWIRAKHTAVNA